MSASAANLPEFGGGAVVYGDAWATVVAAGCIIVAAYASR